MDHVITTGDVLKLVGLALAVIVPIGVILWFISTIDFSK